MSLISLECGVCSELFEVEGELCPYILLCGHSFCHRDIRLLSCNGGKDFDCPTCRRYININEHQWLKNYGMIEGIRIIQMQHTAINTITAKNSLQSKLQILQRQRDELLEQKVRLQQQQSLIGKQFLQTSHEITEEFEIAMKELRQRHQRQLEMLQSVFNSKVSIIGKILGTCRTRSFAMDTIMNDGKAALVNDINNLNVAKIAQRAAVILNNNKDLFSMIGDSIDIIRGSDMKALRNLILKTQEQELGASDDIKSNAPISPSSSSDSLSLVGEVDSVLRGLDHWGTEADTVLRSTTESAFNCPKDNSEKLPNNVDTKNSRANIHCRWGAMCDKKSNESKYRHPEQHIASTQSTSVIESSSGYSVHSADPAFADVLDSSSNSKVGPGHMSALYDVSASSQGTETAAAATCLSFCELEAVATAGPRAELWLCPMCDVRCLSKPQLQHHLYDQHLGKTQDLANVRVESVDRGHQALDTSLLTSSRVTDRDSDSVATLQIRFGDPSTDSETVVLSGDAGAVTTASQNDGGKQLSQAFSDHLDTKVETGPAAVSAAGVGGFSSPTLSFFYPDGSEVIEVSVDKARHIIDSKGTVIADLQQRTGAAVQLLENSLDSSHRRLHVSGTPHQVSAASDLIKRIVSDGPVASHPNLLTGGLNVEIELDFPRHLVGGFIGLGGSTIHKLQNSTGAKIYVDQNFADVLPRKVIISGTATAVATAMQAVQDAIANDTMQGTAPTTYTSRRVGARVDVAAVVPVSTDPTGTSTTVSTNFVLESRPPQQDFSGLAVEGNCDRQQEQRSHHDHCHSSNVLRSTKDEAASILSQQQYEPTVLDCVRLEQFASSYDNRKQLAPAAASSDDGQYPASALSALLCAEDTCDATGLDSSGGGGGGGGGNDLSAARGGSEDHWIVVGKSMRSCSSIDTVAPSTGSSNSSINKSSKKNGSPFSALSSPSGSSLSCTYVDSSEFSSLTGSSHNSIRVNGEILRKPAGQSPAPSYFTIAKTVNSSPDASTSHGGPMKRSCFSGINCWKATCLFAHPEGWNPNSNARKKVSHYSTGAYKQPSDLVVLESPKLGDFLVNKSVKKT